MKRKSSTGITVSRLFLAFLSMVFLFSFLALLSLRLTLFSGSYVQQQAKKADYYKQLTAEINQRIEDDALGSNIPAGILEDTVSEKAVAADVNAYFSAVYQTGVAFEVKNAQKVYQTVVQKVENYGKTKEIEITAEGRASIEELAERSSEIYRGYIELPFILSFATRITGFKSQLMLAMIVSGVLCCILSWFLFSSLRGYLHRLLRYLAYIFSGGGLLLIVMPVIVLISGVLKRLGIQSKAMYDFVQTYLASFLWMFIILGTISLMLSVLFAVWSERRRTRLFGKK